MIKNKLFSTVLIFTMLFSFVGLNTNVQGDPLGALPQASVIIEEVADATLKSWQPDVNFGGDQDLEISYTADGRAASLIKFDLSSLPSEAIVESAVLRLYLVGATGITSLNIGAYFVTSPWDESTVTWNTNPTTGAMGINANIDSGINVYKTWYISSYVQSWIDAPSSNHGVLLIGPSSGDYYQRWFESHEHNEMVPQLEIRYHLPVLSGRVYEGAIGDETTPLPGVNLTLYCGYDSGVLGTPINSTTTNTEGWYGLEVTEVCNYYQIVEIDPAGYTSVGATTEGGTVINPNWIEYASPLKEKTLTGNKFWDHIPTTFLHIISGPTVSAITTNSAVIRWETDAPANSIVLFDTVAGAYDLGIEVDVLTTDHEVLLTGLTPSTTYHFIVQSSDLVENHVESDNYLFETLPKTDTRNPTVKIINPGTIKETVIFQVDAADDTGIKKVEFYWDDLKVFTDFSFPYAWKLSTGAGDNGDHILTAKVFDLSGRSAIDTIPVEVLNFIDKEAPQVNIFHPNHGDSVYGYTSVWVTVSDDSGWSDVELFVEGVKVTGGSFPVSPSLNIKFGWDTTIYPQGDYSLAVKATDGDGKVGTDVIKVTVANPTPSPEPNLVVTKHEAFRHGHTFAVELTVKNQGNAKASQIEILDSLSGFQAIADSSGGVDYETNYVTYIRRTDVTIKDPVGLAPGSSRTYIFAAVPVLMHNNPPAPAIGSTIEMAYTGHGGKKYQKPAFAFEVFNTTYTAGSAPSEPLSQAHANAIKSSSYLIVTDPNMLFVHNPNQDYDQVLSSMAELAFEHGGVLGFLGGSNTDTVLDGLVEPGGDWAKALHSDFGKVGKGYMLIVGEVEIVPAWLERINSVSWSNYNCLTYEVNLSDLRYADTGGSNAAPELILGRIIGNDALDLVNAIQNNLTGSFDRSHYLLASGTDGKKSIEDEFVGSIDEIAKLIDCKNCVTKLHMKDIASVNQEAAYKNNSVDKDVLVYQGHGGVDSWDGLTTDQITSPTNLLSFGSANPVVLSFACLTGSYENHTSNFDPSVTNGCTFGGGDDNIAEAFLDQGAAVFVGSTEVSPISYNRSFAKAFFEKWWTLEASVGQALTNLKRAQWSSNNYARLWMYEYNLYGDPKYGAAPGGIPSTQALSEQGVLVPDARANEALSEIDIFIPDFEVIPVGEFHEVEIPGGDVLLEPGGYRIPYYSTTITYPPGYEVQQVSMTDRSGLVEMLNSGLNIPINEMFIAQVEVHDQDTNRAADGWVPEEQFDWRIMEDPDGTLTLTIVMYPFYYDPVTTDIRFYKNYSFDIDYIISPVTLTAITTNKDAYQQGEVVQADVMVTNSGPAQDVHMMAVLKTYPKGDFVAGLPLQTLNSLVGDASFGLSWPTQGFDPGSYTLEVTLKNTENQVLDRITTTFQLGITSGEIRQLDVTPKHFKIGDTIDLYLRFENTGSVNLSGTLHIMVYDPLGNLIEVYETPFSGLAPGGVIDQEAAWNSSGAERGDYGIVGYALYHGKSSQAKQIIISTEQPGVIYLPLIFRKSE